MILYAKGKIESPTWEIIRQAIETMDGEKNKFVMLEADNVSLVCGGGNIIEGKRLYHVQYFMDNYQFEYTLYQVEEIAGKRFVINIGVPFEFPDSDCVTLADVIKAFQYFYKTNGGRHPDLHWH